MIEFKIDFSEIFNVVAPMGKTESWFPRILDREMVALGAKLVPIMRSEIAVHRYTGVLTESISADYSSVSRELTIGPDAKRGSFDAGAILQGGTKVVNVPWKPIEAWGAARGMTSRQSFFAMKKIRNSGVAPHPFVNETMERGDFRAAVEASAALMGVQISTEAIGNGGSLGSATFG